MKKKKRVKQLQQGEPQPSKKSGKGKMEGSRRGTHHTARLLSLNQVLEIVPVARSTLLRMEKDGRFPSGTFISPNRKVWDKHVVTEWQADLLKKPRKRRRR